MANQTSGGHAVTLRLLPWLCVAILIGVATAPKGLTAALGHVAGLVLTLSLFVGLTLPVLLPQTRRLFGIKFVGVKLAILALVTHSLSLGVLSSVASDQATITFRLLTYPVPLLIGITCYTIFLSMIVHWRTDSVSHKGVLFRDILLTLFIAVHITTWVSPNQFLELFLLFRRPTDPAAWVYFLAMLTNIWLFILIPLTILLVQRRLEPTQIGYTFAIHPADLWPLAVATAVALAIGSVPLLLRLALPFGEPLPTMVIPSLLKLAVHFLGVLGFVALPEELVFRGMLLSFLRDRFPGIGVVGAVFLSSCAFALGHLPQGAYIVVGSWWLGIISGALFVRTRSLATPIFLHAFLNTVAELVQ